MLRQDNLENSAMRYLLGTLSEEERARLEEQYFSDDAQFEEIEIAEEELIDRYVRGELAASDNTQFEQSLAGSARLRERVEFAKLFADKLRTAEAPVVAPKRKASWWQRLLGSTTAGRNSEFALAFSALLVFVAVTVLLVGWLQLRAEWRRLAGQQAALDQRQQELDRQAADLKARSDEFAKHGQPAPGETPLPQISPGPQSAIVFLTLVPGATRSASGNSQIHLLPETSDIQLTLNLRRTDYSSYRATINSIDHNDVFSQSNLKPLVTKSGATLIVRIPAQRLAPGDYYLVLYGEPANESVDDYQFRVIK